MSAVRIANVSNVIYNVYHRRKDAMRVTISKWGNSLGIRIPANIVEAMKLKQGDAIREQNHITQNQRNINNPQTQKKDPALGQNQPAPK